jgi:hypothetical protein
MFHRFNLSATSNSPHLSQPHGGGVAFFAAAIGCIVILAIAGMIVL